MKKLSIFVLMIFMVVFLTGCSEEYIPLTEDESDSIAQYCAYLLMKYDTRKTAQIRLYDYDDFIKAKDAMKSEEEKEKEKSKPTPTPVEDIQPQITDAPDNPDDIKDEDTPEPTSGVEELSASSIEEALGIQNFRIECTDYFETEQYKAEDEYFSLHAEDGKKLFIVSFKVINDSNESVICDFTNIEVAYTLSTDKREHTPLLSLLVDDLQFFNTSLKSKSSSDCKLVFSINKDETPEKLKIVGIQPYTLYFNNIAEVENGN